MHLAKRLQENAWNMNHKPWIFAKFWQSSKLLGLPKFFSGCSGHRPNTPCHINLHAWIAFAISNRPIELSVLFPDKNT